MNATTRSIDKYRLARIKQLGLFWVCAYRCHKCQYVWLPKDFEVLKADALVDRPLPKSCARCKSKSWNKPSKKNISVSRIRALLRDGKLDKVMVLLAMATDYNKAVVMQGLAKDGVPEDILTKLFRDVFMLFKKKEQNLDTFKPPT